MPSSLPSGSSQQSTTWETLSKMSFIHTVYVPCLKLSITSGSFVLYTANNEKDDSSNDALQRVGRVLEVVSSIEMVPQSESFPAIQESFEEGSTTSTNEMPVQFVKVNVFKNRSLLSDREFPVDDGQSFSTTSGGDWQAVVQLEEFDWIKPDAITNLAFVFSDDAVTSHCYDDCLGMCNFFVVKYRLSRNGCILSIPKQACPAPFPAQMAGFRNYWSVDNCSVIFNSIRQIGRAMQRLLCRIAQSQGDFATRNAKLQLPSCSWFYIKDQMERQGIGSIRGVRFSQPRPILSWGLSYHCTRESGELEVLRFDTTTKMTAFRKVFGQTSGYGVRKKRPRYSEGCALLSMNDVINVIYFPPQAPINFDDEENDQHGGDDNSSTSDNAADMTRPFQRFGVMHDGIDLVYNENDGVLQVVLRYRKLVTNELLPFLKSVGVGLQVATSGEERSGTSRNMHALTTAAITPGMEFMDDGYVMRITSVTDTAVQAQRTYRILDNNTTTRAIDCHFITYTDIADVKCRIQEMLE
ncbi:hypothetical protein MHU86_25564 [Fragilaria crotonensis]|nr:hypothetical protein MHU86_25564 [Fragilaria crotonensis]